MNLLFAESARFQGAGGGPFDFVWTGCHSLAGGPTSGTCRSQIITYDARFNLKPIDTTVPHPVLVAGRGRPGPIQIPRPTKRAVVTGTWRRVGDEIFIVTEGVRHTWAKSRQPGCWINRKVPVDDRSGRPLVGGSPSKEARGYAYETLRPTSTKPITRDDFCQDYNGEQQTLIGAATRWEGPKPVPWRQHYFQQVGNVLAYTEESPLHLKFQSVLLNYEADKNIIYFNGGYDYSGDRSPNEPMHALAFRAVWGRDHEGAEKIQFLVGAEHFHQTRGYPILSVVRYWNWFSPS